MASIIGFRPVGDVEEIIEYKTDVIQTFNREQRIQLRERPHITLKYTYLISPQQYSNLIYLLGADPTQELDVPLWTLYDSIRYNGESTITSNRIRFQSGTNREFLAYYSDEIGERAVATSVSGQTIRLSKPISIRQPGNMLLCELVKGRLLKGITAEQQPSGHVKVNCEFYLGNQGFLYSDRKMVKEDGRAVIPFTPYSYSDSNISILREVDSYSNEILDQFISPKTGWHINRRTVSFKFTGIAGIVAGREFIRYLRGRRRAFWLPNWSQPISLQAGGSDREALIYTGWISQAERLINRWLFVRLIGCDDNLWQLRKVVGVQESNSGGFILRLDRNNLFSFDQSNTLICCPVDLCRSESDSITCTMKAGGDMWLSVNVINCPN